MNRCKASVLLMVVLSAFALPSYAIPPTATETLSSQEQADLLYVREEEKVARDSYLTFYDLWGSTIFSNIASSEQMHMDAMLKLLKKYNLTDPVDDNGIGEFTNPALQTLYNTLHDQGEKSELDAFLVGGAIEETDIRDILVAIDNSTHEDIDTTYETLMCGSRNHLRSFAQVIEAVTGQPYVAQVISQTDVDAILDSPMEKCGKKILPANHPCNGKCMGWSK